MIFGSLIGHIACVKIGSYVQAFKRKSNQFFFGTLADYDKTITYLKNYSQCTKQLAEAPNFRIEEIGMLYRSLKGVSTGLNHLKTTYGVRVQEQDYAEIGQNIKASQLRLENIMKLYCETYPLNDVKKSLEEGQLDNVSLVMQALEKRITPATSKGDMQQIMQMRKQIKKLATTDEEKTRFKQLSLKLYTEGMTSVFNCKGEQDKWRKKHQIGASFDHIRKMCEIYNSAIKPIRFFHGTSVSTLLALTHTDKTLKPTGTLLKENQTSFSGENNRGMLGINSHSISLTPSLDMALTYSKGEGPAGEDNAVALALQEPQGFLQVMEALFSSAFGALEQRPIDYQMSMDLSRSLEDEKGVNFLRSIRAALNCAPSGFESLKGKVGSLLALMEAEVQKALKTNKHPWIIWRTNFKEISEGQYEVYPECQVQPFIDLLKGIMATQLPAKPYTEEEQKILKTRPPMVLGMANLQDNLTIFSNWETLHKGNLKLGQDIESIFVPQQYEQEVTQIVMNSFASDEKKPVVYPIESLDLASKLSAYQEKKQKKYGPVM